MMTIIRNVNSKAIATQGAETESQGHHHDKEGLEKLDWAKRKLGLLQVTHLPDTYLSREGCHLRAQLHSVPHCSH